MSTAALGSRSAAVGDAVEMRLRDLERAMGRVASRTLNGSPGYDAKRISATTSGWAVGTWVKLVSGTWTSAATSSSFAPDAIGVVLTVVDGTTAEIVTGGYVQLLGTSYTNGALYYLSTSAGTPTASAPAAPNVLVKLFVAYQDGWINVLGPAGLAAPSLTLAGLRDVTLTSPSDGQLLKYDTATSKWVNGATALTALSDVVISAVSSNQVLSWDSGTAKWINRTLTSVTTLAGLSDVTIASVADLNFLRYDAGSSKWKNHSLGLLAYVAATGTLLLDGGNTAATPTIVGIAGANSRLLLSQTTNPLDFVLSGSVTLGTDISARIRRVSASQVAFFDQGTATTTAGTSVLEWTCSATAASRLFEFKCAMRAPFGSGFGVGGSSISIGTTNAIMVFAGTEVDPDSIYNAGTGVFTAPVAGKYLVTCNASLSCGYAGSPASATVTAGIYKNDTGLSGAAAYAHTQNLTINSALQDNRESITLSLVITLAATDTLCIAMKYANNQNTASAMQIDNGTFSVVFLGT